MNPEPARIGERHEFSKAGGSCRYAKDQVATMATRRCALPPSPRPRPLPRGGSFWRPDISTHPVDVATRARRALTAIDYTPEEVERMRAMECALPRAVA